MSRPEHASNDDLVAGRRHGAALAVLLLGAALVLQAFALGLTGRLQALFHPYVLIAAALLVPAAAWSGRRAGEQVARQTRAARHRRPPWPFLPTLLLLLPAMVLYSVTGRAASGAFAAPTATELLIEATVWVGLAALLASLKGRFRLWRFGGG